jgi:hypothetical protein
LRAKTYGPFGEKIIKSIGKTTALRGRSAKLPGKGSNKIITRQGKINDPPLLKEVGRHF